MGGGGIAGTKRLAGASTPSRDVRPREASGVIATARLSEGDNERDAELAAVFDVVGDGVILADGAGRVLALNAQAERMTGWTANEARGRPLDEVFHVRRVACSPESSARIDTLRDAASWPRAVLVCRDGSERAIAEHALPLRSERGFGLIAAFRDVTLQSRLEAEVNRQQRLEAAGLLVGGVAHDLRNMLSAALARLAAAQGPSDWVASRLQEIEATLRSATGLTTQLLGLARGGGPAELETSSVEEVVADAAAIGLSGSGVRAKLNVTPEAARVVVSRGALLRVLQNLLVNAAEAMPEGGTVQVHATLRRGLASAEAGDGALLVVRVIDSGPGIPRERLERIFDPYFTTKPRGSGLGLMIVQTLVSQAGGWVEVESTLGRGTTFQVLLPIERALGEAAPGPPVVPCPIHGLRVLLVEDDELLRELAEEMLTALGCVTAAASGAEEALLLFDAERTHQPQPFDALLIDGVLRGGVGGHACLQRLRKAGCDARAVLASADGATGWREGGFQGYLSKPFDRDRLRLALASVLWGANTRRSTRAPPPGPAR